jgi:predicted enzyme related to lactoylglutathione lyase
MHQPGTFCWIELATSDAPAARDFYTSLFDWTVNDVPMGEHGTYSLLQKGGRDAAALYQFGPEQQGVPPNWTSYVAVADADTTAAEATQLGAKICAGPFDVFDLGRMAVITDPQGATFAIWQAKNHAGVSVRDEANTLCWNELHVRDREVAKTFYATLFNWRLKETSDYVEFHLGEDAVGGMLPSPAPPEVPSYWLPYFSVEDCDAAVAKASSLGARTYHPPTDIPNVGRFAVLADPQGAAFAVVKLTF